MREVTWELAAGKEVPQRLDGTKITYQLPENAGDIPAALGLEGASVSFSGTPEQEKILVSVLNEGLELNHRQKPAKRAASRENSDVASIQKSITEHKIGVRAAGDGKPRESSKIRQERATMDELLKEMEAVDPAKAAEYRKRMEALRAKKAEAPAEGATASTPAAATSTAPAGGSAKGGKAQGGNGNKR